MFGVRPTRFTASSHQRPQNMTICK
jgi:hypothetical protein